MKYISESALLGVLCYIIHQDVLTSHWAHGSPGGDDDTKELVSSPLFFAKDYNFLCFQCIDSNFSINNFGHEAKICFLLNEAQITQSYQAASYFQPLPTSWCIIDSYTILW